MSPTNTLRVTCAGEAWLLLKASDLVHHDLDACARHGVAVGFTFIFSSFPHTHAHAPLGQPTLVVKRWCNLLPSSEYRAYVSRTGKVDRVRQRKLHLHFPGRFDSPESVEEATSVVTTFVETKIASTLDFPHLHSYDVYVDKRRRAYLLDVNVLESEAQPDEEKTTIVQTRSGVAFEFVASESAADGSERKALAMNRVPLELVTGDLAALTTSGDVADVFEALEKLAKTQVDE